MPRKKYTRDLLEPIVSSSSTISEVIRRLDLRPGGGTHRLIKFHCQRLHIDTTHMVGQAWLRGKSRASRPKHSDAEVFCQNSPEHHGAALSRRLVLMGRPYICEACHLEKWKDKHITLHVHHINGNHCDNRLENLAFLCPNCHQQTNTWGSQASMICGAAGCTRRRLQNRKYCSDACKTEARRASGREPCRSFLRPLFRRVQRPPLQQLLDETESLGFSACGRKYGVSDNAIRKWIKSARKHGDI